MEQQLDPMTDKQHSLQQPQQSRHGQSRHGQSRHGQSAGQPPAAGGSRPQQGSGRLPQQYRDTLASVSQAIQICGWCADQCIQTADPGMVECIRMCEDVVELGETLLALAPRSSRFTADVAQAFTQAAQMCAQECGQHSADHCQECASVLSQAAPAVRQLSMTGGQTGAQMTQ